MTAQLPELPIKERLEKIVSWRETYGDDHNVVLPAKEAEALARYALAGMEQEPVGLFYEAEQGNWYQQSPGDKAPKWTPLYAAPVVSEQPAISDEVIDSIVVPLSPDGLDEERYPCEWHLYHDRERIRKALRDHFAAPDDQYQQLSDLYHAQEKRLFKLAQRIKGASFDKYGYSTSQAIDVLEAAIFGEKEENGHACRAAMQPGTITNEDTKQDGNTKTIGWLRADYCNDNRRGDAPLFVLGNKDPSGVWGVKYIPLSVVSNSSIGHIWIGVDWAKDCGPVAGNSPEIPDGSVAMLQRWIVFGRAMQESGSQLPRNLIAETEQLLSSVEDGPTDDERILAIEGIIPPLSSNSPAIPAGWKLVPIEPTEAMMLHKSSCQHHAWDDKNCAMRQTRRLVWSHMLAAVPETQHFRESENSSTGNFRENAETSTKCWCRACRPVTMNDMRFVVCPDCGNKRCPHANDHMNPYTGSNEPGQPGSAYPAAPKPGHD